MLGKEHARNTNQEAYLFKVDNKKSYDRVSHNFLWDILAALGFDPILINLIKGLVANAMSKFHVNGLYTKDVDLQRGVRQGIHWPPSICSFYTTLYATPRTKEIGLRD